MVSAERKDMLLGILIVVVVANGLLSANMYNQITVLQDNQMADRIQSMEVQVQELNDQLQNLQMQLFLVNDSVRQQIDELCNALLEIEVNLTAIQEQIDSIDMSTFQTQLNELQAQLDEIQERLDELATSLGSRDFAMMNYNISGLVSGMTIDTYFVVNQTGEHLGWPEGSRSPIMKGIWYNLRANFWMDDVSAVYGNYTLLTLIWSPYRNASQYYNHVAALAVHEVAPQVWINDTMAIQGVADVIEMTYSPYKLNETNRQPWVALRLEDGFPEGEYRVLIALKEVQ
jgi:hypothetical protein